MDCPSVVSQKVCVEASVTVEPEAKVGEVHACCVGRPAFEECPKKPSSGCTYMVSQMLCVRFPITISATASVRPEGIVCCEPKVTPCSLEEQPFFEHIACEREAPTITDDDVACADGACCLKPTPLFKQITEETPLAEKKTDIQSELETKNFIKRKSMRRRCGFCFPPLFPFPFCGMRSRRNSRPWQ